ncbi:MAG: YbcC family protein [Crocinitomicaceae bacterium]
MKSTFQLERVVKELKHYLPSQAPLKDFIHHNTLHAFQHDSFHEGLKKASETFGYKTYLQLSEYRKLYHEGKISKTQLNRFIPSEDKGYWFHCLLDKEYEEGLNPSIGELRGNWKSMYQIDLDNFTHSLLFRITSSYLDQGISIWNFPIKDMGFLDAMRHMEANGSISFFKKKRAKQLLNNPELTLEDCLYLLVGNESMYARYLFDQQFAHPGYSGMVSILSGHANALIDQRKINLVEWMIFECLLEIDALDAHFGEIWIPIGQKVNSNVRDLFAPVQLTELDEVKRIWQESFEWTYYNHVLNGLKEKSVVLESTPEMQGIFCIDDRECSIRRYIEDGHPGVQTFGTAGFFGVEFYFQPHGSSFRTKVCPAPVTPNYLIKEIANESKTSKELHFDARSYGLVFGWIMTHTMGFWSGLKLALAIFKPSMNSVAVSSNGHMHADSTLLIEHTEGLATVDGLQVGYTVDEMTDRIHGLLMSIGLNRDFAPLIYIVGHGSSSSNNTHYAGYDCGACSGRPGSVNARVMCFIGNHPIVREKLKERGIDIPLETQFVPVLHDTSRDEFTYYDEEILSERNSQKHQVNKRLFDQALDNNAAERSRRFVVMNSKKAVRKVHENVKLRSVSLFEPRPELNHATNSLCIVGRRSFSRGLFLDRRSFLNSFDYQVDPEGTYLLGILNAVAPVCGGINLEYYFSRVDNQKLGAGSKLPHNVMGLIGVANGIDGDFRTGLPSQMIEVHDPMRLLVIVEHFPSVVLTTIQKNPVTYEWFMNRWVNLVVFHPEEEQFYVFENGTFAPHQFPKESLMHVDDVMKFVTHESENLPVVQLKN